MKSVLPHRGVLLLAFLALHSYPHRGLSQTYPFKVYSTKDGLVQTGVQRIIQDSRGDYWICTPAGLSIFDGIRFRNFLHLGADRSHVNDVLEYDSSVVWVATEGNGIALISRDRKHVGWIRKVDGQIPSDSVYEFHRDRQGNIWIGTAEGIVVLHPDGTRTLLDTRHGLPSMWVNRIAEQPDGTFFIATTRGLLRCRYSKGELADRVVLLRRDVISLCVTDDGDVLAGTNEGGSGREGVVLRFWPSGGIDTLVSAARMGKVLKILSIIRDRSGIIWIGSAGELLTLAGHRLSVIGRENGLPHRTIGALLEDREGMLWIGTGGGLVKLPLGHFISYTAEDKIRGHYRFALHAKDGSVWFGGFGNLVRKERGGDFHSFPLPVGRSSWNIHAFAEDSSGTVWIGAIGGLVRFRGGKLENPKIQSLPQLDVASSLCADPSGDLLVGSRGIIYRIRANRVVRTYGDVDGIPRDAIPDIAVDRTGSIWFGTLEHGLGRLRNGRLRLFTIADGLPSNWVWGLFFDRDSTLWCSTANGYARVKGDSIEVPRFKGIPGERPLGFSMRQDAHGNYWLFTMTGIYEFRDSLLAHYDSREGLPSDHVACGVFDDDNNLIVGTTDGLAFLPSANLRQVIPIPNVRIQRVMEDNESVLLPMVRTFPYDRNYVSLQLSTSGFVVEEEVQYEWRLIGADNGWHSDRRQQVVRYPLLPPGRYEFQARAKNRNGGWSGVETYPFVIESPFWERWWFYASVAACLGLLLWLLYRYRVRQILEVQRVRVRIASDLHDEIGSNLGSIALESQMLTRRNQFSDEAKETLRNITLTAQRTADAMRDIVWLITPDNDSFEQLIIRMRDVASKMLRGMSHTFNVQQEVHLQSVDLEFKRNVFLMFKEILHNILKHSQASRVDIRIDASDGRFRMEVSDNGVGFEPQSVKQGHGWKSLHLRARSLEAPLDISSVPGKGTKVSLDAKIPRTRYGASHGNAVS